MKRTLISFIGKGQVLKGAEVHAYVKTTYDFGGNVKYETSCFADAIRLSGKYTFDEVVFIGTCTSSWSTLLEADPNSEDLCLQLNLNEEKESPLGDYEPALKAALEKLWKKPVKLCVNAPELLPETCEEILDKYMGTLLESEENILLDITHGYRWMPILLTSVLQIANAYKHDGSSNFIEVIYGELKRGEPSPVRYLDILVKGQKISDALSLFFQKFEAEPLADLLEQYWQSGAKAIRKFGMHIQGNYFLPLLIDLPAENFPVGQPMKQLQNAIKDFQPDDNKPAWVIRVHGKLKTMIKDLMVESPYQRLINLAELLADCKHYGQAIVLLCLALEQDLIEAAGHIKHPGYNEVINLQKAFRKTEEKKKQNSHSKFFFAVKELRNRVAHGGLSESQPPASTPQIESLKTQYEANHRKLAGLHEYITTSWEPPTKKKK